MPIRLVTETSNMGKLYTQAEMDEAVKAENEACAKIAYSYFDGIDCAEDIRARIK